MGIPGVVQSAGSGAIRRARGAQEQVLVWSAVQPREQGVHVLVEGSFTGGQFRAGLPLPVLPLGGPGPRLVGRNLGPAPQYDIAVGVRGELDVIAGVALQGVTHLCGDRLEELPE